MKCSYCLSETPSTAKFCPSCGEAVGMLHKSCPHCHYDSDPGANFCINCGTKFSVQPYLAGIGEEQLNLHEEIETAIEPFKKQGEKLLESGFVAEAEDMFESGLKLLSARFGQSKSPIFILESSVFQKCLSQVHQRRGNYDKAFKHLYKARTLIESQDDLPSRLLLGEIQQLIGWNHYRNGSMGKAAMSYYHGLRFLGSSVENSQGAMLYQGLGMLFRALGFNDEAKFYLENCRQIRLKIKDESRTATASINLGVLYTQMGDYQLAENYYRDALAYNIRLRDAEGQAICNANIGYVRFELEKYDEAVEFLINAVDEAKSVAPWIVPICYGYLARVSASTNEADDVSKYVRLAQAALGKQVDLPSRATHAELMAMADFIGCRYDDAIERFEEATGLFEQTNAGFDAMICRVNFGKCLLECAKKRCSTGGAEASKGVEEIRRAVELIGHAMDGFKSIGNEKYIRLCHGLLQSIDKEFDL